MRPTQAEINSYRLRSRSESTLAFVYIVDYGDVVCRVSCVVCRVLNFCFEREREREREMRVCGDTEKEPYC